jgi:soluble lytic murein transglycosylase
LTDCDRNTFGTGANPRYLNPSSAQPGLIGAICPIMAGKTPKNRKPSLTFSRILTSAVTATLLAAASFASAQAAGIPDMLTPSEEATYQAAFAAAEAGDRAAMESLLVGLSNPVLVPVVTEALVSTAQNLAPVAPGGSVSDGVSEKAPIPVSSTPAGSRSGIPAPVQVRFETAAAGLAPGLPMAPRRSLGHLREPVFDPDPGPAHRTNADEDRIQAMADRFYAGDDQAALDRAAILIDGPLTGQAGWIGGLASWRSGDFLQAQTYFTAAANWDYGDDWSRAAGAFWAARAAGRNGDYATRTAMLEQAATAPLTFYGQLALEQLGRWNASALPSEAERVQSEARLVVGNTQVRAAAALIELGRTDQAARQLATGWSQALPSEDLAWLSLARQMRLDPVVETINSVSSAAMVASQYPVPASIAPDGGWVLDRALVFAVMRQESRFDPRAVSRAGARGLMQLMPATAAWMTDRPDLRSNPNQLFDVSLNVSLGERYLEQTMEMGAISNCLIRTIMAYNAGPGSVTRWSGSVRGGDDPLLFMEAIPSGQARVYTERVLSNVWIYHARLGQQAPSLQRLARGMSPLYEPQDNPRMAAGGGGAMALPVRFAE